MVPLDPQVFIDPTGLVKNTLLTPLGFYHKSSTGFGVNCNSNNFIYCYLSQVVVLVVVVVVVVVVVQRRISAIWAI